MRRRLTIAVAALVMVTVVGVVGFALIGGDEHTLLDAVYMTVITLTTVGFGEIIDLSDSPGGRFFTLGLLLVGFGIVVYAVPLMTAFVIEGQLVHGFKRRRMKKAIAAMSGHYIVTGGTALATYVVDELTKSGREVAVVMPEQADVGSASEQADRIPTLAGDPTDDAALRDAGIERAAGLVVCLESDKDNILAVLTARRLAPTARIVATTERPETDGKLRTAGVDAVVCPNRIGGLRLASELVRPTVVSFLDRMLRDAQRGLRVEEVTVPADADAVGKSMGELDLHRMEGVLLLAVREPQSGEDRFKPGSEAPVEAGTTLIVMTDADGRARLEKKLRGPRPSLRPR